MKLPILIQALSLAFCLTTSGCATSMLEQRVVEQFSDALDEENEPALRRIASTRFEHKALRSNDALTDLEVLHLPTDDLKVVDVDEESEDRRRVTVKEESGGKYQFLLVHDAQKDRWVVDDVMVRQRTKGTRITKSTTEVMDLLLTLREFLDTWGDGSRTEILAMVSPELHHSLSQIPDDWMTALAARVAANYEDGMARRPDAQLNVNDAVVKLPAKQGYLLVSMVRNDEDWLINDIELISSRRNNEHPGSIRRQADAIASVTRFLGAYAAQDRSELETVTDDKLFSGALKFADLSMVSLPLATTPPDEFDIRAFAGNLTIMLPWQQEVIRFDLRSNESGDTAGGQRFLVRDVVLYERGTERQRNLASVFTAPTRATLFLDALQKLDLEMLSQISSSEFGRSTWKRIQPENVGMLPLPELPADGLHLTSSNMQGSRTDLEFQAADGRVLMCLMTNENGSLKIDDVHYPGAEGQVMSLKTQLSLATPLVEFAAGWHGQNLAAVQAASSGSFNRLVWSNMRAIPDRSDVSLFSLTGEVHDTRVTLDRATVIVGDDPDRRVKASLLNERGYWVVDELELPKPGGQTFALRKNLREEVAQAVLHGSVAATDAQPQQPRRGRVSGLGGGEQPAGGRVQQAALSDSEASSAGGVRTAVYTRELTLPRAEDLRHRKVAEHAQVREPFGFPKDNGSGLQPAILTRENSLSAVPRSVDAASGVQVFGPPAAGMAMDPPPSRAAVPEADKDGMIYFGPAKQRKSPQVTEPADQPIPLY